MPEQFPLTPSTSSSGLWAEQYAAQAGFVLVPIERGAKGPRGRAWHLREHCVVDPNWHGNIGLVHVHSGTCAVDIDFLEEARAWLSGVGVDLDALLAAPDAVQIVSGVPGHAKLLYRLAFPRVSAKHVMMVGGSRQDVINFRCATRDLGAGVQDVLPPSLHPGTGEPYTWGGAGDWRRLPMLPADLGRAWDVLLAPRAARGTVRAVDREAVGRSDAWPADRGRAVGALETLDPDMDRSEWVRIGMAFQAAGGEWVDWDAWSGRGDKYAGPEDTAAVWRSFEVDVGGGVGAGTLYHRAMEEGGWVPPERTVEGMFGGDVPEAPAGGSGGGAGGGVGGMSAAALADPDLMQDMAPERLRALDGPGVEALVRRLARAGVTGLDLDRHLKAIKDETKDSVVKMRDVYKAEKRVMARAKSASAAGAGLELDPMFEPPEGEDRAEILRGIREAMRTKAVGPEGEEEVRPLVGNVEVALRMGCGRVYPEFRFNELTSKVETHNGDAVTDGVCNQLHSRLTLDFDAAFTKDAVFTQVDVQAARSTYHPVREYLDSLEWDGEKRLDDWVPRLLGAENTPYHCAVGGLVLCGGVERAYRPGCKQDYMSILEGGQGIGKSKAIRMLVPNQAWFLDKGFNVHDLDKTSENIQGAWIVEVGELKGMKMVDADALKQWLTQEQDHLCLKYVRRSQDFPRQCIFIGTTNRNRYLNDETGGRRFLPVQCGRIDVNGIIKERDQLWAEAVHLLHAEGVESAWSLYPSIEAMGKVVQASRRPDDPWTDSIMEFLEGKTRVHTAAIRAHLGFKEAKDIPYGCDGRIAGVMQGVHGWCGPKGVKIDGRNLNGYAVKGLPDEDEEIPPAPPFV